MGCAGPSHRLHRGWQALTATAAQPHQAAQRPNLSHQPFREPQSPKPRAAAGLGAARAKLRQPVHEQLRSKRLQTALFCGTSNIHPSHSQALPALVPGQRGPTRATHVGHGRAFVGLKKPTCWSKGRHVWWQRRGWLALSETLRGGAWGVNRCKPASAARQRPKIQRSGQSTPENQRKRPINASKRWEARRRRDGGSCECWRVTAFT